VVNKFSGGAKNRLESRGKEREAAMGRSTTHVLDTASGRPAAGLKIELWSHGRGQALVSSTTTKSDGRIDAPFLAESDFSPGTYGLRFFPGDYPRCSGIELDEPAFLDVNPDLFSASPMNSSTITRLCFCRLMATQSIAGADDHGV
jgi:5-hydroxyisourate hydrolase